MELAQKKHIERLAVNTLNLKNWGVEALNKNNEVKNGYHRLFDNRIIKLSDLLHAQSKATQDLKGLKELAKDFPNLYNCKGIGTDEHGNAKNGFLKLDDGKVVSINKLKEAIALVNIDVIEPEIVN